MADRHPPRSQSRTNSRSTSTNSSFGIIVARLPRPHFRHSWVSEPAENQQSTNKSGERGISTPMRSEEHTSELQSLAYLVCRLLLEKKKKTNASNSSTIPIGHTDKV